VSSVYPEPVTSQAAPAVPTALRKIDCVRAPTVLKAVRGEATVVAPHLQLHIVAEWRDTPVLQMSY
jgi:hypothetical protein